MEAHGSAIPVSRKGTVKPRWKIDQERFEQMYNQADDFVLAVRSDRKLLSDAGVISGLLQRYGRFDMCNEQLAFGATMGVIELMLGNRFGDRYRRRVPSERFSATFSAMFTASSGISFADYLRTRAMRATFASEVAEDGSPPPIRKVEVPPSRQPVVAPVPVPRSVAAIPQLERHEELVEANLLDVDDLELVVATTRARIISASGIKLTPEFIRRTIPKIKARRHREEERRRADEHRRKLLDEGFVPPPSFTEVSTAPTPSMEGGVDDEDEDEFFGYDDDAEGVDDSNDEDLLEELEVPVEEEEDASVDVPSDDEDSAFEPRKRSLVKRPGEDDEMGQDTLTRLMDKVKRAFDLIEMKAGYPQVAVFGSQTSPSIPPHPFLKFFNVRGDRVLRGTPLGDQFRVAIVLQEVMTESNPDIRTGVNNSIKKQPNVIESHWSVPRANFLAALAAFAGMPVVREDDDEEAALPPTSSPLAAPPARSVIKGQKRAPRVTFELLGKGAFPSDASWTNMRFVGEQVRTLPHGLGCTEIGWELARRAELVGRKCTVAAIQVAFANHLLKKPEDAKTLEMVKVKFIPRTGAYSIEPYFVPAGGKKGRVVAEADDSVSTGTAIESAPEEAVSQTATAAAEAEDGGDRRRGSRLWRVFSREVPRLTVGIKPVDRNRRLKKVLAAEGVPFTERGFQSSFSRWYRAHPKIVPIGVDPTTNGHATGSLPAAHEEPVSVPAPVPVSIPETPAPTSAPAGSPVAPALGEQALMRELLARTEFIAGAAVRAEHAQLAARIEELEKENSRLRSLLRKQGEDLIAASQT